MHLKMTEAHRKMEIAEAVCKTAILSRTDVNEVFEALLEGGVLLQEEVDWMQDYLVVREDEM